MISMASEAELALARKSRDPAPLIAVIPYARLLGMEAEYGEELLFYLPPQQSNVGNPALPALHGGAIGGFMEMSATLYLLMTMEIPRMPKIVDFSIDYVRVGRFQTTWAGCQVVRQGRKLVNVSIHAWQDERQAAIATARAHFVLD